jgi:alpha-glucosidase
MNSIAKAIQNARVIGLSTALAAVRYSLRRDKLNKDYVLPPGNRPASPGLLQTAELKAGGADFHFEHCDLLVRFLLPGMVRLAWYEAPGFSYAVDRNDWPVVQATLSPRGDGWCLCSPNVEVKVSSNGDIRYLDEGGKVLRQEHAPLSTGRGWSQSVDLDSQVCIYGLGERAARLNRRPGIYRFWNQEKGGDYGPGMDPLYISMPVYICMQPAGSSLAFYDNTFDGRLEADESLELSFVDGPACYTLAFGDLPELLEQFTALTGRSPLPPSWALGYHQCRWGYRTQAEMERVFSEFQAHGLPLSGLWMDADSFKEYRTFETDPERYPDVPGMARRLNEKGVHIIVSTNPALKANPKVELYRQGTEQDVFCKSPDGGLLKGVVWPGETAFVDFTAPRVREWWGGLYASRLAEGIEGFWHDMNEPSAFTAWGDMTLPLGTRHDLDGMGGDHRQAHNVYGLLMDRAGYEGLRKLAPQKRPFILSRSGWVGMQRYAWTWTGDIETSWAEMRQTMACVLGLGLSGEPYAGPDIGGFSGQPDPELFVRWFELGSFLPFFRVHSTFGLPNREPWEFGKEVEAILRGHLQNRYRLLPYWYTLAWQHSQCGCPLVRPLAWCDPSDSRLWQIDDAFMLGDALLVAPVVEPGASKRSVCLPAGAWYSFEGDQVYQGGQDVTLEAPLESIPVLVRAGSILPIQSEEGLELHLYAPKDGGQGEGILYSDAGDGYLAGRVDRFRLTPSDGRFDFSSETEGEFPWPYGTVKLKLHGSGTVSQPEFTPVGG